MLNYLYLMQFLPESGINLADVISSNDYNSEEEFYYAGEEFFDKKLEVLV